MATLSRVLGIELMIVTNKPTKPAVELIKDAGLSEFFSAIVGIDYRVMHGIGDVFRSKAEALSYALSSYSLDLSRSAYLGDTDSDRDACVACNMLFIAAAYGFHQWHPEHMPKWYLDCFSDLQILLHSISS